MPSAAVDPADCLRDRVEASIDCLQLLLAPGALAGAAEIAAAVIAAIGTNGKVLFFGNGGSAADAGHLSAELMGRYYVDRAPLPSICLSDATATMTAIANDYGYQQTFSRQLRGLAKPGDVVIGLTTSGNSPNVAEALQVANELGLVSAVFTGEAGGRAADVANLVFRAPTTDTPRVQEVHKLVGHIICEIVERACCGPQ